MRTTEISTRSCTIGDAYRAICLGARPWIALSEFLHAWFEAPVAQRLVLIQEAIHLPATPTSEQWRWAVFCAAGVEWLCAQARLPCPTWAPAERFRLDDPWYDVDGLGERTPADRAWLLETTPPPFARRNVYCGGRVFANKYDFAARFGRRNAQDG